MGKKIFIGLGIALLIVLTFATIVIHGMKNQLREFDKNPIAIENVADGTYEASSETTLVKATVKVTVEGGKITNIDILRHECGLGGPAGEIVKDIRNANTVEVDAVSGATYSSEVIKDAVRKALRQGIKE
ncbi:MAG: FMN-binding protein [Lachnospiraceae bacterium]|nr:FMN-binding protein [Lachnospiraceae bacterium]